ncbi:MAG: aminopeptidase P family protein [Desulfotomaculum sp.]|nr:aminopeptidase P family protein [Desulfotomaculum sp.]
MSIFEQRFAKAQELLAANDIDAVVVTSSPNFFYFTGTWLDSHERLQAVVILKTGTPTMIVHEMAKEQVDPPGCVDRVFWKDGDSSIELLAKLLPKKGKVSIDNQWPSGNLIKLMTLSQLTFVGSDSILGALRLKKDNLEIKYLKYSAYCADQIMDSVRKLIKPGITEKEVAREIERFFKQKGVDQLSFDAIVAAGSNAAIPHHQPGDKVLQEGDAVVVDMGGIKQHYCSDITRTFVIGEPSREFKEVYSVVQKAQDEAVKAIRPGVPMKDIDKAARSIIEKAGYGPYFTHRTGHGIGMEVHEEPYLTPTNSRLLEEGMVVSVEPGIYLPGKFGVRIEDIVLVTSEGAERLNNYPRELIKVG